MTVDISQTIEADSTQVNAVDLAEPRIVTVTGVSKGTPDQPVNIELAEFPGKSFRPCKSMRRVLVRAWGSDAKQYVGRRMVLFNDPSVKWGGQAIGGVRISALSHIESRITMALTQTRGKFVNFTVDPLPDAPAPITPIEADAIRTRITAAATLADLKTVADELKTLNLGTHRDALMAAWSERKTQVSE